MYFIIKNRSFRIKSSDKAPIESLNASFKFHQRFFSPIDRIKELRSFLRQDDNTTGSMHPVFRRFMRGLMVDDEWCFFVLVFEILPASG